MESPPCAGCGGPKPPSKGRKPRRWCSEACRVQSYHSKVTRPAAVELARILTTVYFRDCRQCSKLFATGRPGVFICSDECRLDRAREKGRAKAAEAGYWQQRRARLMSLPSEPINRLAIAKRDGWICQICSDPIAPDLKFPDPGSFSIDHEVPLSLGGHHTVANVRSAHLGCNVRRGNRVA